jgi:ABC-type antimicrobial peptide transport system permease subunit
VIGLILAHGGRLAAAGTIVGMLASLGVTHLLERLTPTGGSTLWVWLTAPLVLLTTVLIASVLPARRALTVDPLVIMRDTG